MQEQDDLMLKHKREVDRMQYMLEEKNRIIKSFMEEKNINEA